WSVAGVLAGLLVAAAVYAMVVRRPASEPLVTRFDIVTPSTSDPFSFALSPNGRQLAFVATSDAGPRVWVRSLDQATSRSLVGTGGMPTTVTRLVPSQTAHRFPQFLPDGRRFLFYVQGNPETRGVYIGSLDGSEPKRVVDAEAAAAYAPPGWLLLLAQGTLVA